MSKDHREEMYFVFDRLVRVLGIDRGLASSLIKERRPFPEICIELLKKARGNTKTLTERLAEINNHNLTSWILYNSLEGEARGDSNCAKFSKEEKDRLVDLILNSGTDFQKYRSAQFLLTQAKALDYGQQDKLLETAGSLFHCFIPPDEQLKKLQIARQKWVGLHPILEERLQRVIAAHKARILGYKPGEDNGSSGSATKN